MTRPSFLRIEGVLGLAIALVLIFGVYWLDKETSLFEQADNAHYDMLLQRHPTASIASNIRLVLLDDRTIDDHDGEFPVNRSRHVQLLNGLAAVGAKSTTWDIVFRRETPEDEALAAAFHAPHSVIAFGARPDLGGGEGVSQEFAAHAIGGPDVADWPAVKMEVGLRPVPVLYPAVAQLAHAAVSVGVDSTHRTVPLIVRVRDKVYPSLTLATIMVYLDLPSDDFRYDAPYLIIGPKTLEQPISVPLDEKGQLLVNYVNDWRRAFFAQSYSTLNRSLAAFPEDLEEAFDDTIVIVGASFAGSGDFIATPLEGSTPGVLLTVNAVNTIMTGDFITPAPGLLRTGLLYAMPLFVATLFILFRPILAAPSLLLFGAGLIGASEYLFASASYFLPSFGAVSLLIVSGSMLTLLSFIRSYRLERRMATVLRRFVAPALLRELEANGVGRLHLQTSRKDLAIMFVDIAGFTNYADKTDAQDVSAFLAEFYDLALDIMFRHEGTVDKLMGDGIIVYWGAPENVRNKEVKAVKAGLALQQGFDALADKHGLSLKLRCGINAGVANVGYFGGDRHAAYTLLGRSVNLAARLETNAPEGAVIIESVMRDRIGGQFALEQLPAISAKGITQPVAVWRITGPKSA